LAGAATPVRTRAVTTVPNNSLRIACPPAGS
jgi:hypothetical protein